jgi:hypothetical protein
MYVHGNPIMYKDPSGHFKAESNENGHITGGAVEKGDTLSKITQDFLKSEGINPTERSLKHAVDQIAKGNKISNWFNPLKLESFF